MESEEETRASGLAERQQKVQIEGQDIEWIWDFLYLGHCFEANADCTRQDVKERLGKAASVFSGMTRIWRSTVLSQSIKLRIYKSAVCSVATYAHEAWLMSES